MSNSFTMSLYQKDPLLGCLGSYHRCSMCARLSGPRGCPFFIKDLRRNLSKRALLWHERSMTPKPPSFLGRQTKGQTALEGFIFKFKSEPPCPWWRGHAWYSIVFPLMLVRMGNLYLDIGVIFVIIFIIPGIMVYVGNFHETQ